MKKFLALLTAAVMIIGMIACGSSSAFAADYKPFTFIFAHDAGTGTPTEAAAQMFKELVEERSGGKITVDLYPGGQLSNSNASTTSAMLQSGDIQMACINGLNNQLWEVYKFPYLFSTLEEVYASEDGASGRYMLDSLKNEDVYGLSFWDVGFRVFTAKGPLNDVSAIAGQKLRIIDSTAFTTFAKALGANPVSTTMGELYTALQQGAADCQENPLATICSRAFYEVTPYVTLTNHVWTYYVFGANLDWWESLPEEARQLIEEVNAEVTTFHREKAVEFQDGYKQKILDNGGTIVELTEEELAAWVAIGRSTHPELEKIVGSEVLDLFYTDLGLTKSW